MPISMSLDLEHHVVLFDISGEVTFADIVRNHGELEAMPGYEKTMHRFADCRTLTRLPTYDEARKIAEIVRRSRDPAHPIRRAYLVLPGAPYGVVRIIQTFASADEELIHLFTDENEARAWVGLPPLAPSVRAG